MICRLFSLFQYFIFYIIFFNRYYVRKGKGIEIIREKPLLFKSQRLSFIISWMVYPFLAVLLYFMITHRHWLKII